MSTDDPRRDRWGAAAEWPLTGVAIMFLAAYAWPILRPELSTGWATACRIVTTATWAAFAVDYVVRLALSR